MRKYNHHIEIINESDNAELFEAYKNDIIEMVKYNIESFDFDINLKILIRDLDNKEYFINKETNGGFSTMERKTNKFVICFGTESLKRIKYDQGLDLAIAIIHELAHIYDLYHILNNKYYKINPLVNKQKNITDFVIAEGWNFWTEFFAYYFTFKEYYGLHNYPTILQLVNGLKKIKNDYIKLKPIIEHKNQETLDKAEQLIQDIKVFIYSMAKHIAGDIRSKPKRYKYVNKTKEKPEFKKVEKLYDGLLKRVVELFSNTYGKGLARKLENIGDYIIRNIYMDFDLIPIKHKNYITFAFFTDN